jgi:hypothetical protein
MPPSRCNWAYSNTALLPTQLYTIVVLLFSTACSRQIALIPLLYSVPRGHFVSGRLQTVSLNCELVKSSN